MDFSRLIGSHYTGKNADENQEQYDRSPNVPSGCSCTLIDAYEREHVGELPASPVAVLRLLMDDPGLTQSDLPELGSQGVVSERLRGRRQINVRQVRALSARFGVSPAAFI